MIEFYKDKVVLITGGSMGIGKEIARLVLESGSFVIITGRNEEKLLLAQKYFSRYADRLLIHAGDISDYADDLKLADEISNHFGRLDIVISNAGLTASGDLELTTPDVIEKMIDVNIKGSVFLYNSVIPELKKTKGSIFFVSSVAALRGLPSYSLYSLSKMALTGLTQSIRIECKKYGVFVGIAYVGFTRNDTEKTTYSPQGKLEKVPQRKEIFLAERYETAAKILNQIRRRRSITIQSFTGKCMFFLTLYFPWLVSFLFEKNYMKKSKNRF